MTTCAVWRLVLAVPDDDRDPPDDAAPAPTRSREELIAKYQELLEQTKALRVRHDEIMRARAPAGFDWRGLLVVLLCGGFVALVVVGVVLAGSWGLLGAIALPVVVFFAVAWLPSVIHGAMRPIGTLSIAVDGDARVVRFASTAPEEHLELVLLAALDRCLGLWSMGGPTLTAAQRRLINGVRVLLETSEEDEPLPGWRAEPGEPTREMLTVGRDRLGVVYTYGSSIGGSHLHDDPEVCLALVRLGLAPTRPRVVRFELALRIYCDHVERRGHRIVGRSLRRAARVLER